VTYLGRIKVQIGIQHNPLHLVDPKHEKIITEVFFKCLDRRRCGTMAHVVVSAHAEERDGRVHLAHDGLKEVGREEGRE
jgi:hypothetical protein